MEKILESKPPAQKIQVALLNDAEKSELDYIYTSLAKIQDRRAQVFTIFGTANVTVIGLALQQLKAGLILIGIALILIYIISDLTIRSEMAPFLFRGFLLERKYNGNNAIIRMHLLITESHTRLLQAFDRLAGVKDEAVLARELRKLFYRPLGYKHGPMLLALSVIAAELALWGWLYFFHHWILF